MFNSRNLGALIVDDKPHVKEWDEPQFGIQNLGIEESYGFGVLNEGLSDRCRGVLSPAMLKRGGRRRQAFGQRARRADSEHEMDDAGGGRSTRQA
jgi:hypothetical protein